MSEFMIDGETIITPPPGYGIDQLETLPSSFQNIRNQSIYFGTIPEDPVPLYSLFNGPTIGLGEEILRRIYDRTLVNYDDEDYILYLNEN
uniref:Uncharacterized protein n=1 Tax=Panagrolaimus sp. ES5 TaxID=591445 RepID=A0AC34FP76_9BILA